MQNFSLTSSVSLQAPIHTHPQSQASVMKRDMLWIFLFGKHIATGTAVGIFSKPNLARRCLQISKAVSMEKQLYTLVTQVVADGRRLYSGGRPTAKRVDWGGTLIGTTTRISWQPTELAFEWAVKAAMAVRVVIHISTFSQRAMVEMEETVELLSLRTTCRLQRKVRPSLSSMGFLLIAKADWAAKAVQGISLQ